MRRSGAEQIPSILLATLSASFGVCLLETTSVFGQVISANSVTGSSSTLVVMLQIVASVFIVIAV
jgi:putative ABC transport system permease protein